MRSRHEARVGYAGDGVVGQRNLHWATLNGHPSGSNPFRSGALAAEFVAPSGRAWRVEGSPDDENTHHVADHARRCVDETLEAELPPGRYRVQHDDPKSGSDLAEPEWVENGRVALALREFLVDHVVHLVREG